MSAPARRDVPFLDLGAATRELHEELAAAQRRVLDSGRYVLGTEVGAFETAFAAYCGTRHCIGVGNGLDALELLLRGSGIGSGDDVLVPSNTYIATWLAVTRAGARPVPVEPDPRTANVDPGRVIAALTPATRAILAVHLYGRCADMKTLRAIADAHRLKLFEDAAQAHGAMHAGRRAGSLGDGAGFSFYPSKNLGALGDAGAVTTDDDALAEAVRTYANYGSRVRYVNEVSGMNSRLDELQAACLAVKLRHLDAWNARRRRIAARYADALADSSLGLPPNDTSEEDVWHLYVIRHERRDALRAALAARGIGTEIHYPIPPHRQSAYATLGLDAGSLPLAERLAATVLSLPNGPQLGEADAERVISAVRDALRATS